MIDVALLHDARQAVTGANVHRINGLIGIYRTLTSTPGCQDAIRKCEEALREEIAKARVIHRSRR
jgi:hypothetical protein